VNTAPLVSLIVGIGLLLAVAIVIIRTVKVVNQGHVGVVTRLGEFRKVHDPGLVFLRPFVERLVVVDVREFPRTGDRQEVITRDNVAVAVNATIFSQVVDARAALFAVTNYVVAIDQQARTTLRNAFGNVTLDEALSERERINANMQTQMETVTDKWGIRINRIEVVDITPPAQILQALALQKQADQEKRAAILTSEGQQQSAVNIADGQRQAAIKQAEGERQAAILRAEGNRQAAILEAEGRAKAIETVYGAIKESQPDQTLVAILQLDTLAKFADSDGSTVVVPYEAAGLMGAAQALRATLGAPTANRG
jgi:regulator of protease activity HflC (stomatin/prohibitin superfamily)